MDRPDRASADSHPRTAASRGPLPPAIPPRLPGRPPPRRVRMGLRPDIGRFRRLPNRLRAEEWRWRPVARVADPAGKSPTVAPLQLPWVGAGTKGTDCRPRHPPPRLVADSPIHGGRYRATRRAGWDSRLR